MGGAGQSILTDQIRGTRMDDVCYPVLIHRQGCVGVGVYFGIGRCPYLLRFAAQVRIWKWDVMEEELQRRRRGSDRLDGKEIMAFVGNERIKG